MDILSALEGTAAADDQRCKIGRWLDSIPAEQPGRAKLIAAFETETKKQSPECYRQLDQLDKITRQLGLPTSVKTIGDHRAGRCRCSQ